MSIQGKARQTTVLGLGLYGQGRKRDAPESNYNKHP